MKKEDLDQTFLKNYKKRVLNSINPFSAPISYNIRLKKALNYSTKPSENS
jgi:hypothetical protein